MLLLPPGTVARMAQDPGEQLPVAAHPPMDAADGHFVMGRELLEQVDVSHQARAREDPFEEIVAERSAFSGTRPASTVSNASTS